GNRYPDYDTLNRISEELGVGASELLGQNELNNMTIDTANKQKSPKIMIIALVLFIMSAAILALSIFNFVYVKRDKTDVSQFDVAVKHVYGVPEYCGFYAYNGAREKIGSFENGVTVSIFADGTFSYYETIFSSYLGFGKYTVSDDGRTLTLETDDGKFVNTFVYSKENDALIFIAEESTNFLYVKLEDKTVFERSTDRSEGVFIRVE
ncbi:MAG: hypothetical protein KBS59_01590, partial [Clostridiales bacterium]|nr:hypothetical protein [Clostridiales bacterium]